MPRYSDSDPYLDPATGVLINRLGIADEATLEQTEAAFVATRSYELLQTPLKGHFDLAHRQAIHSYLFGDVYEWAGQLRTIDISKGGNRFAHHAHIENAASSIFQQLGKERQLAGLDAAAFSDQNLMYKILYPRGSGIESRDEASALSLARRSSSGVAAFRL